MKMDMGKYRGSELSELPTDYLEWALVHLSLSDELRCAAQADYSRRVHEARLKGETRAERVLHRAARPVNRIAARVHEHLSRWLHGRRL